MMPDRDRGGQTTLLAFSAMVLIGGLNFIAVRFSNRELPPFWGAAVRFSAAALLLYAVVWTQRLPLPRGRALVGVVFYGLLAFGLTYALAYWGIRRVPGGLASVVFASTPLFTFLLAVAQGQERFQLRTLTGTVVALAGIAIIFAGSVSPAIPLLSLGALIAAAIAAAEAGILAKRFPRSHPVTTNAVAMTVGALLLFVISTVVGEAPVVPVRAATWVALGHLVLLGSSAVFVLYLYVLRQWAASAVSYMFVLFPLVAIAASAWLEGEPLTLGLLGGGALVLAGVYFGGVSQPAVQPKHLHLGSEPCLTCVTPDAPAPAPARRAS